MPGTKYLSLAFFGAAIAPCTRERHHHNKCALTNLTDKLALWYKWDVNYMDFFLRKFNMSRIYNSVWERLPTRPASLLFLMVAYIVIVLLHVNLLSPYFLSGIGAYFVPDGSSIIGGFIGDEAMYRLYAEVLLHLEPYPADPLYPPAYPLMLALAELLSPTDPIKSMIILNIAVASAVMFPIYALARQMLAHDLSFGAAIVAGFMPATFIFAPALMSENLSTTLFVTAFWLALRRRPANVAIAVIFGVVVAFCFLTKFLFLITIPFLVTAFIINQWLMTAPFSVRSIPVRLLLRLAVTACVAGIIPVALWSAYLVASGGTVAQSLGLHISTLGMKSDISNLAFIPHIFAANGLAIIAAVLPVLPAVLVAIRGRQHMPILIYVILLGTMTVFMWLFISWYSWRSMELFSFPQPICERYFMMMVPIYIPLAFVGLKLILDQAPGWKCWHALAVASICSLALAILVQAGFYDRIIWELPAWTTVIWAGGPDVLYGAIGFPAIIVTAVVVGTLAILRLVDSFDLQLNLIGRRVLRFGIIATATASLAAFNLASGLAGANFAWKDPYVQLNSAHARAITKIIGDRSRDPRPALVSLEPTVVNSIETSTGKRLVDESRWWVNMQYWSGRLGIVPEAERANYPRYWVALANHGADPATTYRIGVKKFQVKTAPN